VVERAKAGDKVVFTGMIAVAPDISGKMVHYRGKRVVAILWAVTHGNLLT